MSDGRAERLLLDTCAIIWMADGSSMSQQAKQSITDASANGQLYVSPISAWEIGMVMARGKIRSPLSPAVFFQQFMRQTQADYAQLTPDILIDSSYLPGEVHGDPADRILIATARSHNMAIVTRDREILNYAQQGHVEALEC